MFVRETQRKNKDGSVVRYLSLAHNARNERGVPQAKVVYNFGRAENVDKEALKRLVSSLCKIIGPDHQLQLTDQTEFEFCWAKELGGPWVISHLFDQLGFRKAIEKIALDRRFGSDVAGAILALICQRALAPASKLDCVRYLDDEIALGGVGEFGVEHFYRAMDFLLDCQAEIEYQVFSGVADLLNLDVDLVLFDASTSYFEADPSQVVNASDEELLESGEVRRFGFSKDHRPDLLQVMIGLAVTKEGIPVRAWTWPGNTSEYEAFRKAKQDLDGWDLRNATCVIDRGISSKENLRYITEMGSDYIAGIRFRKAPEHKKAALAQPGRYQKVDENLYVKEVTLPTTSDNSEGNSDTTNSNNNSDSNASKNDNEGDNNSSQSNKNSDGDGEKPARFIICKNSAQQERDLKEREMMVKQTTLKLADLDQLTGQPHKKAACKLRSHPIWGRYITQTSKGKLKLDQKKIRAEERLDGKYLLETTNQTMNAANIAKSYKNLTEAERGFRDLKGTLKLRPIYHRKPDRIRSHILICYLALLIIRTCEVQTGETWRNITHQLAKIKLGHYKSKTSQATFSKRTELTKPQQKLLTKLGIKPPPQIPDINPK